MTDYEIRQFQPADRESYLDLYGTVFGGSRGPDWFEWKYGAANPCVGGPATPAVDGPPVFVALEDGDVVGARSFFALRMTTGETTRLALQPSDAMVHPAHRRRGLFTDLTRAALSQYADREPAFCFNFPNPKSLRGNLQLGWAVVADVPTHYRVHDPAALSEAVPPGLASVVDSAASAYYRHRTPSAPDTPALTVRRFDDPPAATLAALARHSQAGREERVRARRDETFYDWRLAAPGRTYETVVAERGGEPAAALVVARDTRSGTSTARVLDAVALGDAAERREAFTSLLESVLAAHRDAATVVVRGGLPTDLLRRFEFLPDTSLPLSPVTSTTTMVARPIGDADWTVDGHDLREADSWGLAFAELDSA